jgi:surface polysaccharide O-acyltransferase-like enzyme
MKRDEGINTIRILLTFLVIIHHVSIVYGGAGGWYWKETQSLNFFLVAFNTVNQSFFMGVFFLLAGYFSRFSIEKKGGKLFLKDRVIRLGIPLFAYFFLISPFTIALANPSPDTPLLTRTLDMMKANEFEPGPLWFVFSLLIFSVVFAFIYRYLPRVLGSLSKSPRSINIAVVLILVGICAFVVRLFIPVGETLAWLQIGYFPMYILLFCLGIVASKRQLLSSIEFNDIKVWLIISSLLIALLPIVMTYPPGNGRFEGGANINSLFYALWEPFFACGIILGLFYVFSVRLQQLSYSLKALSPLAYCIYIIHPPVVVYTSITLYNWNQGWPAKLVVNSCISILACVALSWLILKLPYARRVL